MNLFLFQISKPHEAVIGKTVSVVDAAMASCDKAAYVRSAVESIVKLVEVLLNVPTCEMFPLVAMPTIVISWMTLIVSGMFLLPDSWNRSVKFLGLVNFDNQSLVKIIYF